MHFLLELTVCTLLCLASIPATVVCVNLVMFKKFNTPASQGQLETVEMENGNSPILMYM